MLTRIFLHFFQFYYAPSDLTLLYADLNLRLYMHCVTKQYSTGMDGVHSVATGERRHT